MSKLPLALALGLCLAARGVLALPGWYSTIAPRIEQALVQKYGEEERARAARGLRQMASLWQPDDGDAAAFEEFALENFAGDKDSRDALFARFQEHLSTIDGHCVEIGADFRRQLDLDGGTIYPFDGRFAAFNPSAHIADDFFANKLAFVALLNFPLATLKEELEQGPGWTRRDWAEARINRRFESRVPAKVVRGIVEAERSAESYVDGYKIHADTLVDPAGRRPFAPGTILVAHWGLRDEIRARYSDPAGLDAQRLLAKALERIVEQSIPQVVINNPAVLWSPSANTVVAAPDAAVRSSGPGPSSSPEPDTRYAFMLDLFRAHHAADAYHAAAPTLIVRKFDVDRQFDSGRAQALLESVLGSPQFAREARYVAKRLGRPLEAFDIWYADFPGREPAAMDELDAAAKKRYPTLAAFRDDLPRILATLGFAQEPATRLLGLLVVEPSRGPGQVVAAGMAGAKTRLRVRVGADGMDFAAFSDTLNDLGRALAQTIAVNDVDYPILHGLPSASFAAALGTVARDRAAELLGVTESNTRSTDARALGDLWQTAEVSGAALVELETWRWLYAHPYARAADLRTAVLKISRDVWNRWFAPVFGVRDSPLLAVYSHMVFTELFLADYAIGPLAIWQIEGQMTRAGNFGAEFQRMSACGALPADPWMKNATGKVLSADDLLAAAGRALDNFDR